MRNYTRCNPRRRSKIALPGLCMLAAMVAFLIGAPPADAQRDPDISITVKLVAPAGETLPVDPDPFRPFANIRASITPFDQNGDNAFYSINSIAKDATINLTIPQKEITADHFTFRLEITYSGDFPYEGTVSRAMDLGRPLTYQTPLSLNLTRVVTVPIHFRAMSGRTGHPLVGARLYLDLDSGQTVPGVKGQSGVTDAKGDVALWEIPTASYRLYMQQEWEPIEEWQTVDVTPATVAKAASPWIVGIAKPSMFGAFMTQASSESPAKHLNIDGALEIRTKNGFLHQEYVRSGIFYAYGLSDGHYEIALFPSNSEYAAYQLGPNTGFDIVNGAVAHVIVALEPRSGCFPATFAAVDALTGKPILDAPISVNSQHISISSGFTDDAGRFNASFLLPNEYEIRATAPGYVPTVQTQRLSQSEPPEPLRLMPVHNVTLDVFDTAGKPFDQGGAFFLDVPRFGQIATEVNEGRAQFKDVPVPNVVIGFWSRNKSPAECLFIERLPPHADHLVIHMQPTVSVAGAVIGQLGQDAEIAFVSTSVGLPVARCPIDSSRHYAATLPPGSYSVYAASGDNYIWLKQLELHGGQQNCERRFGYQIYRQDASQIRGRLRQVCTGSTLNS